MPPAQKKFVKYTFEEPNSKPKESRREQHRESRENFKERENFKDRDNFKERDNNQQGRTRRHVSYTEKPSSRQNVLRDMVNSFVPLTKPSPKVQEMMKKFPKYFNQIPKEPEPWSSESLNPYLAMMSKKILEREAKTFVPIEIEEEQDPDWDSDSDVQNGIESKKIDQTVVEKALEKMGAVKQLRQDELKRHEKQFLEDYYRQKHQESLEKQKNDEQKNPQKPSSKESIDQNDNFNEWTEYQQKQVEDFVNMGFIQKIQEDENDDFGDEDFSVEDEKSQSESSDKSSEDGDNDIFGDEGPTTIVKKKEETETSFEQKPVNLGTVVINSHVFSRIAEAVGIPPGACIWIIRNNKNLRYKVSTQFMDEMYRLNNFCESLPYVSLNHSEFVHNSDVEKEKGLEVFKKFNARKHQSNHQGRYQSSGNGGRNYDNNKRKFQYKPANQASQKPHLNKK